jgi:hypothetical protein
MTAEHRASLAWLAATAAALETHYREIRDERDWTHEQLRSALQTAGVKSFSDQTIGVSVSLSRPRRRYLQPLGGGRYRLVSPPSYVKVSKP